MKLYESELKVMEVLWNDGEASAKRIAEALKEQVAWSKTTTYTVIKKCVDKGAVERVDPGFMCRAKITREDAQRYETDELIDRFGEPPASVKGLLDVALLRNIASQLGLTEIKQQGDALFLYKKEFDLEMVGSLIRSMNGRVMLSAGSRPYISVKIGSRTPLESLSEILSAMEATVQ